MIEHTMHTLWRRAHQVLYPTETSPVAAAIMSCGLISKFFESSLWLKNRGSCVQACGVIYEGTPLISSTFGLGTVFSKTSIYCKLKTIPFLYAFFVLFCFVYRTPGIILTMNKGFNFSDTTWAPWRFRTKTTPNKRRKLCITNPLWGWGWGLQSSVGSPQKRPLMRKTFPCYAGESVWNQGCISNTIYRNLCWIL